MLTELTSATAARRLARATACAGEPRAQRQDRGPNATVGLELDHPEAGFAGGGLELHLPLDPTRPRLSAVEDALDERLARLAWLLEVEQLQVYL